MWQLIIFCIKNISGAPESSNFTNTRSLVWCQSTPLTYLSTFYAYHDKINQIVRKDIKIEELESFPAPTMEQVYNMLQEASSVNTLSNSRDMSKKILVLLKENRIKFGVTFG